MLTFALTPMLDPAKELSSTCALYMQCVAKKIGPNILRGRVESEHGSNFAQYIDEALNTPVQ